MLVYPAAGLRVRDPATRRFVPDEGLEVSETDLTWARLLRDGDVVKERPAPALQDHPASPAFGPDEHPEPEPLHLALAAPEPEEHA